MTAERSRRPRDPAAEQFEHAQCLDAAGFNVLRASRQTKRPVGSWKKFQTERTTPYLKDWFCVREADFNFWTTTGSLICRICLDCDNAYTEAYWREVLGADVFDATTTVRTRAGCHKWFTAEPGVVVRSVSVHLDGDQALSYDLKAEGAGVVLPPSVHATGFVYKWEVGPEHMLPAPAVLLNLKTSGLHGQRSLGEGTVLARDGEVRSKLTDLLNNPPAGENSGRDVWLTQVAGHYGKTYRNQRDTYEIHVLAAASSLPCPLPDLEVWNTLESIWNTEQAKEGDLGQGSGGTIAAQLVDLAEEFYTLGVSTEGDLYAVRKHGQPRVALPLRAGGAGGAGGLRGELAKLFRQRTGRVATQSALADALNVLDGIAADSDKQQLHLRVAQHEDSLIIDLGDQTGRCVVVTAQDWSLQDTAPVLFRRTALTCAHPEPIRGGSLQPLRDLLNVDEERWSLLVGWLVAGFFPDISHPILLLIGVEGAAKSTAARCLVCTLDPTAGGLRAPPTNPNDWGVKAQAAWAFGLDNVSHISPWLSDALCRAVTGDIDLSRRLYTNAELVAVAYRRVLALTTITATAWQSDLASRMLQIDLDHIDEEHRRDEEAIDAAFDACRADAFGALLDLLVQVFAVRPTVVLDRKPRMADFARILATLDACRGTDSLGAYRRTLEVQEEQVLEADWLAQAIIRLVENHHGRWEGTAQDLLETPIVAYANPDGKYRIKNAHGLSGKLKRLETILQKVAGIRIERFRVAHSGARAIRLERVGTSAWDVARVTQGDADEVSGDADETSVRHPQSPHSTPALAPGDEGDARDTPLLTLMSKKREEKGASDTRRDPHGEEVARSASPASPSSPAADDGSEFDPEAAF